MRKINYISFFSVAFLLSFAAHADENADTELLIKTLSASYGADVAVNIDKQRCEVVYPEVTIEEEVIRDTDNSPSADEQQTEAQKITTTLSATTAQCTKTDDFDTHTQYQISHNSPNKILAQLYNNWGFAFVKNFDIKNFSEELRFVPDLGLVSSRKIHVADASYTSKDETTGLKKEVGNLGGYELLQEVTKNNDKLKYQVKMDMDMLNVALPIFSLQIKSEKNISEIEYSVPDDNSFDYTNIVQNFAHVISAKSAAVGRGIKIGINLLDIALSLDTDIKNNTQRADDNTYYTYGTMALQNITIASDLVDKEKQPQAIALKYMLKDLSADSLVKFGKLQQEKAEKMEKVETFEEMQAIKNSTDEKAAEIMDELAQKAKLNLNIEMKYPAADITADFALERKNGYLFGVGKVKVTNLYNIFPKQKQCLNNPKADEIPDCKFDFAFSGIKNYVDITKDDSETVYTYNEQGVFKNNVKIGEPIELNFKKMYTEKRKKEQKREEMMRKLMEEAKKDKAQSGDISAAEMGVL